MALKLTELRGIFGRQRFGDRGEELRHLHDRALQAAERGGKRRGVPVAFGIEAEEPPCHDPGRDRADVGADPPIADRAGAKPVLLLVGLVHRGSRATFAQYIGAATAIRPGHPAPDLKARLRRYDRPSSLKALRYSRIASRATSNSASSATVADDFGFGSLRER